ncbi:MAG: hypothetical protein J6R26_01985 [Paludibacteraceae bacterium]|nr:hypothetical protein [Paludibacteraceae bacterium]
MKKVLSFCVMCLLTLSAMSQKTVWIDLDLPSGTKWKSVNESGFYSYESAIDNFGKYVPTKEQWQELRTFCVWTWQEDGYRVTGNNGNSIFLPAAGYRDCNGDVCNVGTSGGYWSSTPDDSNYAWRLDFKSSKVSINAYYHRSNGQSVRLVQ